MIDSEHRVSTQKRSTEVGKLGEELAAQALRAHGYEIIERNWRCPQGEIDIIACQHDVGVLVEVKTRTSESFGTPEDALTSSKQSHILNAGRAYIAQKEMQHMEWRVDVVAVKFAPSGKVLRLDIYQDAVRDSA